jgi:hypothetical protein
MAGVYITLWALVLILGRDRMPIPAKTYLICCGIVDLTCLILQGAGGGMAGAAISNKKDTAIGTKTMLAGIIIQLISTITFDTLFNIVVFRGRKEIRKSMYLMCICGVIKIVVTCMVIRNVYRSVELLQGWRGLLITHEKFAVGLEGVVMAIASVAFNFCHPRRLLVKQVDEGMDSDDTSFPAMSRA